MLHYFVRKFKYFALIFILSANACNKGNAQVNNMDKASMPFKIYCAGPLFNQKDLIGNLYLADSIYSISNHKYKCLLPQNIEQRSSDPKIIKNNDLINVRDSDAAIFSFDGTDPDSGTVTEFIQAKFLDKPAVLYRSDFRAGGDSPGESGDQWNLMMSNYPRTNSVIITDILPVYQKIYKEYGTDSQEVSKLLSNYLATQIVKALDVVCSKPPIQLPVGLTHEQIKEWFNRLNDIQDTP